MNVLIIGAGAMGSALSIPLMDNGINVSICGTEYDIEILDLLRKGEKHPRIGVGLEGINILYPEMMSEAVADHDVVLLAVSTDGVESVFSRINQDLDGKIVVTISKGFLLNIMER
jgi:glycerol-3-phosphate dehydrogenase (NAD(P)+)